MVRQYMWLHKSGVSAKHPLGKLVLYRNHVSIAEHLRDQLMMQAIPKYLTSRRAVLTDLLVHDPPQPLCTHRSAGTCYLDPARSYMFTTWRPNSPLVHSSLDAKLAHVLGVI
jgi:hypothetical protein